MLKANAYVQAAEEAILAITQDMENDMTPEDAEILQNVFESVVGLEEVIERLQDRYLS